MTTKVTVWWMVGYHIAMRSINEDEQHVIGCTAAALKRQSPVQDRKSYCKAEVP